MAISVKATSTFEYVGTINANATPAAANIKAPSTLATGDYLVIAVNFQALSGTTGTTTPAGFTALNNRGTASNRLYAVYGKTVTSSGDASSLIATGVDLKASSSGATRVAGVAIALTGVDPTTPIATINSGIATANSAASSFTFSSISGSPQLGFLYSNTSATTAHPDYSTATNNLIVQAKSYADTNSSTADTVNAVFLNPPSTVTTPNSFTNAGGFLMAFNPAAATVAPVANFTAMPTTGALPLAVVFTDTTTNQPTSWSWDFGDGTTSTSKSPSHTYTTGGTFSVSLAATNSAGSNTATKTNLITVANAKVVKSGVYKNALVSRVKVSSGYKNMTISPYQVRTWTVSNLVSTNPFYIAHRGSGDNWPEHTFYAYNKSVKNGMKAIEVSVRQTSDGIFVCHHDADTSRMAPAPQTTYTIANTAYATLQQNVLITPKDTDNTSQQGQPIPKLTDVLDAFLPTTVIFLEAKVTAEATALLNLLDTYSAPTTRVVWKQYVSGAQVTAAKNKGYKTWGYYNGGDISTYPLETKGVNFDYLGIQTTASDADTSAVVSYANTNNKPVITWPIKLVSERSRAINLGVKGMMTSNIKSVLPTPL